MTPQPIVVAIDPGVQLCYYARLDHWGVLAYVGTSHPSSGSDVRVDTILVERPIFRAQDARYRQVSPQTLIDLAWSAARAAYSLAGSNARKVVELTPQEWKGTEPKPVQHARLLEVLSDAELALVGGEDTRYRVLASQRKGALDRWSRPGVSYYGRWTGHNVLDAVALALTYVGRLAKR